MDNKASNPMVTLMMLLSLKASQEDGPSSFEDSLKKISAYEVMSTMMEDKSAMVAMGAAIGEITSIMGEDEVLKFVDVLVMGSVAIYAMGMLSGRDAQ